MSWSRDLLKRPGAGLAIAAGAVALLSAFSLAWVVPPFGQPVRSDSYMVGYNNAVATAGVLIAAALAAFGGLRAAREGRSGAAHTAALSPEVVVAGTVAAESASVRGRWLWVDTAALALGLVGSAAAIAWFTWGMPFADHLFFFARYAYTLQGAVPYTTFDFPYGPVLLYLPVALYRLAGSPGSDAALGAYYVAGALQHAIGAVFLGYSVSSLPLSRPQKRAVFWIAGTFALLGSTSGPNYSLFRFAAPVAAVVMISRSQTSDPGTRGRALRTGVIALVLTVATAAISPEMAVAVLAGALALTVRGALRGDPTAWWGLLPLAPVPVTALLAPADIGSMLAGFAGGALNLPLLPSPYMLAYVASILAAMYYAGRRSIAAGPAAGHVLGLASVGGVLAVPALGRADLGHVFWNGMPLFFAVALALAAGPRRRFAVFVAGLALAFIVGVAPTLMVNTVPMLVNVASRAREERGRFERAGMKRLLALDDVAMPFGAVDDLEIAYALKGALVPTHGDYLGPANAGHLATIERDLRGAQRVVLPTIMVAYLQWELTNDPALREPRVLEGATWSSLLQFPVHLHQRREDYPGLRKLAEYLASEFSPGEVVGSYVLMERGQRSVAP
jgi:hypothetical protein